MSNEVIHINEESFDALINAETPTLVDFWAPWCGPCVALSPTLDELAKDFEGKATVAKVNVDDHPGLGARFGISSIPAVLIFEKGEVTETMIGLRPKEAYAEALTR